ncbi:hypothetical protein AARAC_001829 [Aspergillus arachidicola]|uniref:Tat pathway signal sequence n=1 Tax=Aspergillus arachidicola TaxID=656916 RepID=A0A2G7FTC5_9EURO|nr:hypothetical protein AARAC_001829 [Aspergillus arachidicola]
MAIWTTIRNRCKSFTNRAVAYHKIDDGETKEVDRQKWESVSLSESTAISQRQVQSAKSLPVVLLFTSAVFFAICLIFRALTRGYASIDMACTKRLSAWAPMMEAVDYQWTQYDSDRLPADYAGPPTVTRETNWLNQYDHGFIPYPYDQIATLNKSTDRDWWVQDGNLVTLTESPVLKGEDLSFSIRNMDATLFPDDNPSIFRQEPSPEVDRAWTIISDTRPIALSREDVLSIGKDPAMAVKLSAEFGLGDDMYAGRIDVLHQLHCLNALRMEIYFDYYYGKKYRGGFNQTDEKHRHHVSHCIYMLLQNILCHANTDVYTHFWTDAVDHPWPDFNIPHKCTNFRAILEWQREHAVNEHMFVDMRRPGNQEAHVMSSKFKKIYNPERFGHLGDNRYGFVTVPDPEAYDLKPNREVVPGTNNTFMVSVYHQLHCLKIIHLALLPIISPQERLGPGTQDDHGFEHNHLEHCLDYLRQSVMCSGDVTLEPPDEMPKKNQSPLQGWGVTHACRSWEQIEGWRGEWGVI